MQAHSEFVVNDNSMVVERTSPPAVTIPKEVALQRPLFIEIFAGTGNLSKHMFQRGFDVICIDWKHNKHTSKFSAIDIDLGSEDGQNLLWTLLHTLRPVAMHAGVACGTSSRAREKELPEELRKQGAPRPVPLRSASHPMGIPNLSHYNQQKVVAANKLYVLVFQLILYCFDNGIVFSVENPWRSWFWSVLVELAKEHSADACRKINQLHSVVWDTCMHGGARAKRTRLDATQDTYNLLQLDCNNQHEHAPYRVFLDGIWKFDTASEGAYPDLLCKRMSEQLAQTMTSPLPTREEANLRMQTSSWTSKQHKKFPQLVPEFWKVFEMDLTNNKLPPLCKELGPSIQGGASMGLTKVGQFHSIDQFLHKAKQLQHPLDTINPVPDSVQEAIFNILTKGPAVIAEDRVAAIKHAMDLDKKLNDQEKLLHARMPPYMRKVMKGKKILLFKELLVETGYDDIKVCDFLEHGVQLFGHHTLPPYASTKIVPAVSTVDQLQREAVWRRKALRTDATDETADLLDSQSLDEVNRGFLSGPFETEDEVSVHVGREDWIANPRFVLLQGPSKKPRVIDNCRQSGLNATYTSLESLQLHDFDMVVSVAKLASSCNNDGMIKVTLSTGEVRQGPLHPSLTGVQWKARSLDLAKAYKQLAVHPNSRHLAIVGYQKADNSWKYFASNALPFGASASVFGFLRVSRAIWHLATTFLGIPGCCYFDDFPHYEVDPLCHSSQQAYETLLKILGWKFAEGEKNLPFDVSYNILGATVDMHNHRLGTVSVSNKQGRLEHIASLVRSLKETMSASELAVLRGHIVFASGFCLGRALRPAMGALDLAFRIATDVRSSNVAQACEALLDILARSSPRLVECKSSGPPIVVFTDSAFDNQVATVGALVVDPMAQKSLVYDGAIHQSLVSKWQSSGAKQIISQAELAAVVLVRDEIKRLLENRKVIFFVDNEAARYSLIKGVSGKSSMQVLTSSFHAVDIQTPCFHWIERVPSKSNPADLPTRGKTDELLKLTGATYAGTLTFSQWVWDRVMKTEEEPIRFFDSFQQAGIGEF